MAARVVGKLAGRRLVFRVNLEPLRLNKMELILLESLNCQSRVFFRKIMPSEFKQSKPNTNKHHSLTSTLIQWNTNETSFWLGPLIKECFWTNGKKRRSPKINNLGSTKKCTVRRLLAK